MVDIQTFLRAFLHARVSLLKFFFLVKSTFSSLGNTHLKHWIIEISGITRILLSLSVCVCMCVRVCVCIHTHTYIPNKITKI